jgi:hypothetical protein
LLLAFFGKDHSKGNEEEKLAISPTFDEQIFCQFPYIEKVQICG